MGITTPGLGDCRIFCRGMVLNLGLETLIVGVRNAVVEVPLAPDATEAVDGDATLIM